MAAVATKATKPLETDEFGYTSTHIDTDAPVDPDVEAPAVSTALVRPTRSPPVAAAKPKRKLHLHLGRLGRSKAVKPEPARLRDVTDIRIENPTFTRENLHQRNYDAFFESGEPVYSLERRPTPEQLPEPDAGSGGGFFGKMRSRNAAGDAMTPTMGDGSSTVVGSQKGDRCFSPSDYLDCSRSMILLRTRVIGSTRHTRSFRVGFFSVLVSIAMLVCACFPVFVFQLTHNFVPNIFSFTH